MSVSLALHPRFHPQQSLRQLFQDVEALLLEQKFREESREETAQWGEWGGPPEVFSPSEMGSQGRQENGIV